MKSLPLINTCWLRPFREHFADRGRSIDRYLKDAAIEPRLVADDEGWITKRQLYRFLNEVASGEKMPEVGFVVGERLTPEHLGALGQSMSRADRLADALQLFCRLIPRHVEDNRVWLEEGDAGEMWLMNEVVNRIEGESDIANHAGMMTLTNIIRLAAGPGWYPRRVMLQGPPTDAWKRVPGLAGSRFEFDREATGITFPAAFLLEPVGGEAARAGIPRDGGELLTGDEQVHQKITALLRSIVGVGGVLPSVHLIAGMAGTSTRTLHRRLRDEGRAYQEILDEVRFERAKELLLAGDATIKELSEELGFSGANNFVRYFKRYTGVTPSAYRKERTAKREARRP